MDIIEQMNVGTEVFSSALDDGPLVLVALAAAMTEHQCCMQRRQASLRPESATVSWRTVARWEQLRGGGGWRPA